VAPKVDPKSDFEPQLAALSTVLIATGLATLFLLCSHCGMERNHISSIILNAPAWARVGLTVRDERLRERAADALAATIVDRMADPPPVADRNQLALPL
jgi:hypothetical protein